MDSGFHVGQRALDLLLSECFNDLNQAGVQGAQAGEVTLFDERAEFGYSIPVAIRIAMQTSSSSCAVNRPSGRPCMNRSTAKHLI